MMVLVIMNYTVALLKHLKLSIVSIASGSIRTYQSETTMKCTKVLFSEYYFIHLKSEKIT